MKGLSKTSHVLCVAIAGLFFQLRHGSAQFDPCYPEVYGVLDDYRRDVNRAASTPLLCDLDLSTGWYRFFINGSSAEIPTSCVQPNRCGTQAPIWLQLDLVPELGQEVTSIACSSWSGQGQKVNCCFFRYSVSVKNCGLYFVYKLGSSLACNIAYCAQAVKIDPSTTTTSTTTPLGVSTNPSFTTAPGISTSPDDKTGHTGCQEGTILDPTSQLCVGDAEITVAVEADNIYLFCNVSSELNVSQVEQSQPSWCEQVHFDSSGADCLPIKLDGSQLLLGVNVFTGQTIVCELEVLFSAGDVKVFRSRPFFVGLQIKERQLAVSDNGTSSTFTLTSSIPVPCGSGFDSTYCRLGINLLVFDTDGHYLPRLRFSTCYLELLSSQCGAGGCEELPVQLALFPDPQGRLTLKDVVLVAGISYTGPGTWAQTSLDVQVHLEESTFGSCHVITDPHVLTFDGKVFDLYRTGTFTLYYSSFLDFTVEIRVATCPGGAAPTGSGFCTCGVVVAQGHDVVSVDNCHQRQSQGHVEVTYPLGAISRDVRVYEHETKRALTVVFLSGRRLRIYVEKFGLNVGLFVPSLERGRGRGLCGNYDNDPSNDFMKQNGGAVAESVSEILQALEFIESWRLQPSQSKFDQPDVDWKESPALFLDNVRCDCSPSSAGDVCPVTPFFQDTLTSVLPTKDATDRFYTQPTFPVDQRKSGKAASLDQNSERRPYYFRWDHLISSQLFLPTWPTDTGIKEEMADEACAQFLFRAPLTLTCADFGFVGLVVSTAFDLCKKDIQVKDDMSWANHSTRLIESVCEFAILERAANFTSSDVGVTSSLPSWPIALRDAIGCPVGCGRGYCDEGRCLCDDGLTGEVCNIVIEDADSLTRSTQLKLPRSSTASTPSPGGASPHTAQSGTGPGHTVPLSTLQPGLSSGSPRSTRRAVTTPAQTLSSFAPPTSSATDIFTPLSTRKSNDDISKPELEISRTSGTTSTTQNLTSAKPTLQNVTSKLSLLYTTAKISASTTSSTRISSDSTEILDTSTLAPWLSVTHAKVTAPVLPSTRSPRQAAPDSAGSSQKKVIRVLDPRFTSCDISQERCTIISFKGPFPLDALRCRLRPVKIRPGRIEEYDVTVVTSSILRPRGQFLCMLPSFSSLPQVFPGLERLNTLKVEVTTSKNVLARAKYVTIFDSTCLSCDYGGQFGCVVKEGHCYIENVCYAESSLKPADDCLQCVPAFSPVHWSPRQNNLAPVIYGQSSVVVFQGQEARMSIKAHDPEGSKIVFGVNRTDASISQSGEFLWRAADTRRRSLAIADQGAGRREISEAFTVTAKDSCNATTSLRLVIRSMPCECANGGICRDPRFKPSEQGPGVEYDCTCPEGFLGERCELREDQCSSNPCARGTCVSRGNHYTCECDRGFSGELCDQREDPCESEPCFPAVTCSPSPAKRPGETGFKCGPCPEGYTGDGINCVAVGVSCSDQPCFPGVACFDLTGHVAGYRCGKCPRFFSGDGESCVRSDKAACSTGVCSEVSKCTESELPPGFRCEPCPVGYYGNGVTCTAECLKPCPKRQTCVRPNECGCAPGYVGRKCDHPTCYPKCRYGGVCVRPNLCRCFSGYSGSYCQTSLCSKPCQHGGRCLSHNRCLCPYGYSGSQCHIVRCRRPCQNGGQCVGLNRCRCPPGYQGRHCETPACSPACLNGGTCLKPGLCACPSGYQGQRCQEALCSPPCQNGGKCVRFNTCKCPFGYRGHRCHVPVCHLVCMNQGRCVGHNQCMCTSGWAGQRCDQPVCRPSCKNGGLCVMPDICSCTRGFYGADCSKDSRRRYRSGYHYYRG
ncbi:hypothetical protein RRG08_055370 [Elysia crispata]|uniref:von Willebrand factor D and EGF domain-containing protein n=1 Tax=Elysia crispata TaxID=231223 RepID=A0AAE1E427_9GAST|nr:hypothetical protein RRG08_055370 [Elysia crispata]